MIRNWLYTLSCLIALIACKKESLPVASNGDPVFTAEFTTNEAVSLQAGVNSYSMSPVYATDTSSLIKFRADLYASECAACNWGISFLINNTEYGTTVNESSAFQIGDRYYEGSATQPVLYKYEFKPNGIWKTDNQTFHWEVRNDTTKRTFDTYSLTLELKAGTTYTVKLDYDDGFGGCVTSHTRIIRPGSPLYVYATVARTGNASELNYQFTPSIQNPQYSYLWTFGDTKTSTLMSPTHKYDENGSSYYCVLRVVNTKGDTSWSHYQVPGTLGYTCQCNFSAKSTPIVNNKLFQSVEVLLSDKNGKLHSSKNITQPADSYFRIVKQEPYGSLGGVRVRKLQVIYQCLVASENATIAVKDGKAITAVGYP
jgi:PKD repeat protein